MEIIKIESKHNYTEWSKYYSFSIDELKNVFTQRHLDWEYYYNKASNGTFSCGLGDITITTLLTEYLQDYDDTIRYYYYRNTKNFSIDKIFENWKDTKRAESFKFIN